MSHSISRRRRWRTCATTLALTLGSLAVPAAALADGQLDPAFNGTGYHLGSAGEGTVFTNSDNRIPMIAQADGRIVVGGWVYSGAGSSGDYVVARYVADGTLDAGFGNAGITITPVAPASKADEGRAIVLQIDDRVPTVRSLLAGSANDSNNDFAVTRYWH